MRNTIHAYSVLHQGDWSKIAKSIIEQTPINPIESKFQFITIVDEHYPKKLLELRFPPWILYYEGNLELLEQPSLGIVGSRMCCEYAKGIIERLCRANADKVIISGLAKGADAIAHYAALSQGTIGIIGCGLDVVYPKENQVLYERMKKDHLILSEYPEGVPPRKHHFPWRNRIIAGLSDQVVAAQAKIKSGTATTIMHATDCGRPVYAVPYPIDFEDGKGCNLLISQGAEILLSCDEKL